MSIQPLAIDTSDLKLDIERSSLNASFASGVGAITIYSINNFAIDQLILIGELGDEGSEIIKTDDSTAPSGNTVTLLSNLIKSHAKDTSVYILRYDQIEFSHSVLATGTKTVMVTKNINAEDIQTIYDDDTYDSGFYHTRYYNTITETYSSYGDPIPYAGLAANTVGYIVNLAMQETGKNFSEKLTFEVMIAEINACLRYIRGSLKKWSNFEEFNYILDQMNRGEYRFALPSTYYDKNSNRSLLDIRIADIIGLDYVDVREMNEARRDVVQTTVATTAAIAATSLVLTSTANLGDTGTIHIYKSNTLYSIDFSANDKDTNTLIVSALEVEITADLNAWYGESESRPQVYTINDGYIEFWPLIDTVKQGADIILDFYTDIVVINSDADEISYARFDMIKHWLKWQIRNIVDNDGKVDINDDDYKMFLVILNDAKRRETTGQKYKQKPKINGIFY